MKLEFSGKFFKKIRKYQISGKSVHWEPRSSPLSISHTVTLPPRLSVPFHKQMVSFTARLIQTVISLSQIVSTICSNCENTRHFNLEPDCGVYCEDFLFSSSPTALKLVKLKKKIQFTPFIVKA